MKRTYPIAQGFSICPDCNQDIIHGSASSIHVCGLSKVGHAASVNINNDDLIIQKLNKIIKLLEKILSDDE